jgi:hypothetical protein
VGISDLNLRVLIPYLPVLGWGALRTLAKQIHDLPATVSQWHRLGCDTRENRPKPIEQERLEFLRAGVFDPIGRCMPEEVAARLHPIECFAPIATSERAVKSLLPLGGDVAGLGKQSVQAHACRVEHPNVDRFGGGDSNESFPGDLHPVWVKEKDCPV